MVGIVGAVRVLRETRRGSERLGGASCTGDLWVVGDSPRTPKGGQAKKEMGGANRTGDLWEWWEFSKRLGVLGKELEK